jgi:hypothetical protein
VPSLPPNYTYYIKNPAVPMNIPFTGVNNNDCLFTSSLNLPPDNNMYTFTPADVLADAVIDTKFTKMADSFLTITTSDISFHLTLVTFTLTVSSLAPYDLQIPAPTTPPPQSPKTYTFTIKLVDNPCDDP